MCIFCLGFFGVLRLETQNFTPETQFSSQFYFCLLSGPSGKSASLNSYIHKNVCCILGLCSGCLYYGKTFFA